MIELSDDSLANRSGILSLPDELLHDIFSRLISPFDDARYLIPFWYIINKRMYDLSRPIFYRSFTISMSINPETGEDSAPTLNDTQAFDLLQHPKIHNLIQYLSFDITHLDLSRSPAVLLPLLSNIKAIELCTYGHISPFGEAVILLERR